MKSAVRMTSIRLDTKLADDALKVLGAKTRTEAVHMALQEVVALKSLPLTGPTSNLSENIRTSVW